MYLTTDREFSDVAAHYLQYKLDFAIRTRLVHYYRDVPRT